MDPTAFRLLVVSVFVQKKKFLEFGRLSFLHLPGCFVERIIGQRFVPFWISSVPYFAVSSEKKKPTEGR